MATPNKLEVVLSFKPLMDGLNRFVGAYQTRMLQLQDFNRRIQGGEAAVQRALGQVGVLLGAAALAKYARDARDADRVQQQLNRTLQRTGETGAANALNEQASALQRVTLFSDESVSTVQRLLITFGLTAKQAQEMTESVLDLAQETGQSAESAAMLVGRTLRGETDELGRLNIKLDTSKGKVDALGSALKKQFGGAARGAVADKTGRDIETRYANATEDIGRAVNRVVTPFLEALIPLLERIASGATVMAEKLAPIAPMLGDMAVAVLPGIVGLGLLSGVLSAVMMVINPLRAAVVLFAGRSLLELSNALAMSTGGASGLWSTLKNGGGVLAGLDSALASVGGVLAAFFAGWELGKLLGEVEAGGTKLKSWVSGTLLQIVANAVPVWGKIKEFFSIVSSGLAAFYLTLELGAKVALNPLGAKKAWADYKTQLQGLAAQATKELADIKAETEARVKEFSDMAADVVNGGRPGAGSAPSNASAPAPTPRADLNGGQFGDTDAAKKAAADLQLKRDLYELETRIILARAAGDLKLEQSLQLERDYLQGINDLGKEQGKIIDARQAAQLALIETERDRQFQEQRFSREIAELEASLALIEQDKFTTQQEKDTARIQKLTEINAKIAERIALLEREQLLNPDPTRQGQIDDLRGKTNTNAATQADIQPLTMAGGAAAGIADYLSKANDLAGSLRQHVSSIASSLQGGIANGLAGVINRTLTWGQALRSIAGGLMQSIIQSITDMAAQWIMSHLIMKGVSIAFNALLSLLGWERVAESNAQEAAKTPALMTNAAAANAGSFGMAAVVGIAVLLAMMASFATGGLVTGPGTGTSDSIPARLSNGEFVATAAAVDRFGVGFFNGLNAGALDLAALPGSIAGQIPAASAGIGAAPVLGAAGADAQGGQPIIKNYYAFFSDRPSAREWLNSKDGQKNLIRMRGDLGLET